MVTSELERDGTQWKFRLKVFASVNCERLTHLRFQGEDAAMSLPYDRMTVLLVHFLPSRLYRVREKHSPAA